MSERLLIKGGTVLSMDPAVGEIRSADVLVEDGAIAAIGAALDVSDCDVIDASGMVVMPGLVDSHRHLWYATVRGVGMDLVLRDLRTELWPKVAAHYTPDDVYVATRAAILDALDHGITTVFDWCHIINSPEHADEAVRAHRELPMRAVFGFGASMTRKLSEYSGSTAVDDDWSAIAHLRDHGLSNCDGRVTLALALQGPEANPMEASAVEIAASRELGLPMSMHVGMHEGAPPRRSIGRLAEAALLGPDMQFVHCCSTTAEELARLADAGAAVVVCPVTEIALAIGIPPTGRIRDAGLAPALGADAVCSTSGDLFDEARVALLTERCLRAERRFADAHEVESAGELGFSSREALEAVTINGARACWLGDRVGSLTVGKRADIVLLRASDLGLAPLSDVVGGVVGGAHGGNVDTVLVDGKVVKRHGRLVGVDLKAARSSLERSRDKLFAAGGFPGARPLLEG
ncbi:MAG TPA: amidohydrolase family protein [Gaiellaceae bacterium]